MIVDSKTTTIILFISTSSKVITSVEQIYDQIVFKSFHLLIRFAKTRQDIKLIMRIGMGMRMREQRTWQKEEKRTKRNEEKRFLITQATFAYLPFGMAKRTNERSNEWKTNEKQEWNQNNKREKNIVYERKQTNVNGRTRLRVERAPHNFVYKSQASTAYSFIRRSTSQRNWSFWVNISSALISFKYETKSVLIFNNANTNQIRSNLKFCREIKWNS